MKKLKLFAISILLGTTFLASCSPTNDNPGDIKEPNDDKDPGENKDPDDNKDPNGGENPDKEPDPEPEPEPEISKALKITSLPTKVEYRVNESLSYEGLEVKLFTTTDDVTDEGVVYTNFTPSVEEGYVFKEEDMTSLTKTFEIVLVANDENIRSTSFELTVLEEEKVPVEITTTLYEFMKRLNDGEPYEIKTPYAKGTFLSNAIYWDVSKSDGKVETSYGFAHRDSDHKTILFTNNEENSSSYVLNDDLGNSYSSIYDEKIYPVLTDPYPYKAYYHARSINTYNLNKFKNAKPKKDTHIYTLKPETSLSYDQSAEEFDANSYTKYVSLFLRLASNNASFPISDFALGKSYTNLSITIEFVTNEEVSVFVNTTSSDTLWPSEYSIKINPDAKIDFINGFLDGTDDGSEGGNIKDPDSEVEGGTGEGI